MPKDRTWFLFFCGGSWSDVWRVGCRCLVNLNGRFHCRVNAWVFFTLEGKLLKAGLDACGGTRAVNLSVRFHLQWEEIIGAVTSVDIAAWGAEGR